MYMGEYKGFTRALFSRVNDTPAGVAGLPSRLLYLFGCYCRRLNFNQFDVVLIIRGVQLISHSLGLGNIGRYI